MKLEIERVWVLSRLPEIPAAAACWEIEQGYLPLTAPSGGTGGASIDPGRIRRVRTTDGQVRHFHTVKRGTGLVREETEREISAADWDRQWPLTVGARLAKTRFRVREGDLVWEVDEFRGLGLVMAEVELPTETSAAPIPRWLQPFLGAEVTSDPRYRNSEIARRGAPPHPGFA